MDTNQSNYGYNQESAAFNPPERVMPTVTQSKTRRGRPKVNVSWPNENFTVNKLIEANGMLSSSSLRKKRRVELTKGGLVKVGTLKTAFGRPQDIYKKSED